MVRFVAGFLALLLFCLFCCSTSLSAQSIEDALKEALEEDGFSAPAEPADTHVHRGELVHSAAGADDVREWAAMILMRFGVVV